MGNTLHFVVGVISAGFLTRVFVAFLLCSVEDVVFAQNGVLRDLRTPSRSLIEDFDAGLGATRPNSARPLKPLAPELIMDFEGWEPSPYDDPSGYCTVGFGHLIKKSKCADLELSDYSTPLTKTQGQVLLEVDTLTARAAVQRLVTRKLEDHEFGALASFVFNVGKQNFADSTMRKLLNQGLDVAAAKEFDRWIVSDNKVLPGLIARRACEAALFRNRLKGNTGGHFVRLECAALGAAQTSETLIDITTGQQAKVER